MLGKAVKVDTIDSLDRKMAGMGSLLIKALAKAQRRKGAKKNNFWAFASLRE
jgi:hypothetical protein